MFIYREKGRYKIYNDNFKCFEIKSCCSNCAYYQRTYKICKIDDSKIIGNTYHETNCKDFYLKGAWKKIRKK